MNLPSWLNKITESTKTFGGRFWIIMLLLMVYVAVIVRNSYNIIIRDGDHYRALLENMRVDNIDIPAMRGFIFSGNEQMIAASIPKYDIIFDFRPADEKSIIKVIDPHTKKERKITTTRLPMDTMLYYFGPNGVASKAMERLYPSKRASQHGADMMKAYINRKASHRHLAMRGVSYLDFKMLRDSVPFFKKQYRLFWLAEERPSRLRPYGDKRVAASTIGSVYASNTSTGNDANNKGHGRNGLEKTFDKWLAGEPGRGYKQMIRRRKIEIIQEEPVDGADVYTTLDMDMQIVLDEELSRRITELQAVGGWAAVMEVKTGKILAISNLKREGMTCVEDYNHFVMDRYDPGSTFKTVSYMVMLDDGKITPETMVNTGGLKWEYHGRTINDDHLISHPITADEAIVQSSNISLAKMTTQHYGKDQQRYLDLVYGTKIFDDMHLDIEFDGALAPKKRDIHEVTKDGRKLWSAVSLAQVSYGYESEIPAMYMLSFYNAIANDGKLMRPYIVEKIMRDGKVLYEMEPTVINSSICKSSTVKAIRHALEGVVEHGTASRRFNANGQPTKEGAQSKKLKIAGKTGTAQRNDNGKYVASNGHNVSFAGYFPADDPQYSCIVVLHVKPNGLYRSPGGGYMAGPVFRRFAEQVYAQSCYRSVKELKPDSTQLGKLEAVTKRKMNSHLVQGQVPNVIGMGANDALYALESVGLKVDVMGRGTVTSQSIAAGSTIKTGQKIIITCN